MFRLLSLFSCLLAANVWAMEVNIMTKDGTSLRGFSTHSASSKAVLFLHQCNRNQKMWKPLTDKLNKLGYSTTTVDFRGYGSSKSKKYNVDGTDDDYLNATKFVKADVHDIYKFWLSNTKKANHRIIVGASCGGGAAGILAANYDELDGLILFSPSMRDYWMPEKNWAKLSKIKNLPVFAVGSQQDKNAMAAINRFTILTQATDTKYVRYNGKLHGEPLFKHDINLADSMVSWIEKVTSK